MKACMVCGCTDTNACVTPNGPCAWASHNPPICTACIGEEDDDGGGSLVCAHSFLFTDPTTGHCVHCREPYCEEIAA